MEITEEVIQGYEKRSDFVVEKSVLQKIEINKDEIMARIGVLENELQEQKNLLKLFDEKTEA